jgi:subtilisin family serine protease
MPSDNEQALYRFELPAIGGPHLVLANSTSLAESGRAEELTKINEQLNSVGWVLRRESPLGDTTEPIVTPLLLSPIDPLNVGEVSTPQAALRALPRGLTVGSFLDELVLDGFPAHKPGFHGLALTRGDFNRVPVAVLTPDPPPRRERDGLPGGRRPVIGLFDTDISRHPWLDAADPDDPIWIDAVDHGCRLGPRAPAPGEPRGRISTSKELESDFGHGTFSAGLIRQIAPDALILLFRVIHNDGTIHGDHLLNALGWVRDEHDRLVIPEDDQPETRDPGHYVDVICLPLGYEYESKDQKFARFLGDILGELGMRDIRVVAAAGNEGTDRPTYPAAFAVAENPPRTPLVSVGALNPNGRTRAHYSNHGDWVTDWAVGTSVVSAFPLIDGPASAELGSERRDAESVDPDDFTGGFSRWSGTSFAATALAGMLGQALLTPEALAAQTPQERAELALLACRQGA